MHKRIKPTLADLASLLRRKQDWPEGFTWDPNYYHGSPIGLLWRLEGGPGVNLEAPEIVATWAAILQTDPKTIRRLFISDLTYWYRPFGFPIWPRPRRKIGPELVAQAIERHLRKMPKPD